MTKILPSVFLLAAFISSSCAQEYQCSFSAPLDLGDGVTMEHVKNSAAGTYTVRLSYSQGQAWVGIGINTAGWEKMVPGNAVIGRVEADGSTSVLQYSMTSDSKDGSGVLPMVAQNLIDASFVQTDTESILTYTQPLNDDSFGFITDESSWIWAVGLPDNVWEGKHQIHGSFFLPLQDNCVSANTPITDPPMDQMATTPNPTASPTFPVPMDQVEELEEEEEKEEEEEDEEEEENEKEEEQGGKEQQEQGPKQESTHNTASTSPVFTSTSNTAGLVTREDATKATHPLWIAHGWVLGLAWGLFAPLAVGAGILRHVVGRFTNWYQIHFYLNLLVVALTIVGFSLAVAATNQENKPHFAKEDDTIHHQSGLAIFIVVILQAALAYMRPAAPASTKATAPADGAESMEQAISTDDYIDQLEASAVGKGSEKPTAATSLSSPLITQMRKAWEIQHRFTGAAIVGLAWYNCHTGYELMEENYSEADDHTNLFWGVTSAIAGMIFFLAYVVKVQ